MFYVLLFLVSHLERIDWSARVKIIMGVAYCLQYMHHDLNPPMAQSKLTSNMIFLTDDFSAKVQRNDLLFFCLFSLHVNIQVTHFSIPLFIQVAEVTFKQIVSPESVGDSNKSDDGPSQENIETNVYKFGELLLEIISGKLPYSEEHGNLVDWVSLKHTFLMSASSLNCNIVNIDALS